MRPGGFIVGQSAAVRTAIQRHHSTGRAQGSRIITPPRAAIAQVVEELMQAPLSDHELTMLIEVSRVDQPEQIEARLKDTRLWRLLQALRQNDVRILTYVMALLMIVQLISDRNPPKQQPASPPPAPQVTVIVEVPTDEIVDEIERRFQEQDTQHGGDTPAPPAPDESSSAPADPDHRPK
jgi:hypothetical protein